MKWSPFTPKCGLCKKEKINRKDPATIILGCSDGELEYTVCDTCMALLQTHEKNTDD